MTELRHVHRLAMAQVWEAAPHPDTTEQEGPGSFRRHGIKPFAAGMQPPDWTEVPALMNDWVKRACALLSADEPLPEAVAVVHAEFERIHPFLDGNGRVGRLLMNMLLIRLGYPPAIIRKGERTRYLQNLRRADAGDPGPLGEFLARAVTDTLMRFIVPAVAGPARLVPLAALADHQLSVRALRTAAERGRLRAQRDERGQWRSSRLWVEEYRGSRYQRVRWHLVLARMAGVRTSIGARRSRLEVVEWHVSPSEMDKHRYSSAVWYRVWGAPRLPLWRVRYTR